MIGQGRAGGACGERGAASGAGAGTGPTHGPGRAQHPWEQGGGLVGGLQHWGSCKELCGCAHLWAKCDHTELSLLRSCSSEHVCGVCRTQLHARVHSGCGVHVGTRPRVQALPVRTVPWHTHVWLCCAHSVALGRAHVHAPEVPGQHQAGGSVQVASLQRAGGREVPGLGRFRSPLAALLADQAGMASRRW